MVFSKDHMAINIPANAPQHVYAAAAEQALAWGQADGALNICELGLSRHPAYTGLRLFRAEALLKHNQLDGVEDDLRAVLAAEPQHPKALKLISSVLMEQRRYRDALRFLERAEFLLPGDKEVVDWLKEAEARKDEEQDKGPALPDALYSPEVQARVGELLSLAGVQSVVLDGGTGARIVGQETGDFVGGLKNLAALEDELALVMTDAGLGELSDITLQDANTTWSSRRSKQGVVRVAASNGQREGLVAWHVAKILAEEAQ